MQVEILQKEDLDEIVEIERECFSDPWQKEAFDDCLRYPYYYGFVVKEGGQVCGYCCLTVLFDDSEVLNVAVRPACRGRGIAKAMMAEMHARAKALGATRSLLEVRVHNAAAISLYGGLGYLQYGIRKKYYPDGEDAMLMYKQL